MFEILRATKKETQDTDNSCKLNGIVYPTHHYPILLGDSTQRWPKKQTTKGNGGGHQHFLPPADSKEKIPEERKTKKQKKTNP